MSQTDTVAIGAASQAGIGITLVGVRCVADPETLVTLVVLHETKTSIDARHSLASAAEVGRGLAERTLGVRWRD